MGKSYAESSLKRFLKRKVKVTLGLVVAFLITGNVGYAVTKNTIKITNAEAGNYPAVNYPFIENTDFTKYDEQYIEGDSLASKKRPSTGNRNLNGIVTTDGKDIEIKFNKLQFDVAEPDNRNSYSNRVIIAERNNETITMSGKDLIINVIQKNYNGSNSSTEKEMSTAVYSKGNGKVILNADNTKITVDSNVKNYLDATGMTADNNGNIEVNGNLNIAVNVGAQGYGILTNQTGKVILNGKENIIEVYGHKNSYISGIRVENMSKVTPNDYALKINGDSITGGTTIIKAIDKSTGTLTHVTGIYGDNNISIEGQNKVAITTNSKYTGRYSCTNSGISMKRGATLDLDSKLVDINVTTEGKARTYGIITENVVGYDAVYPSGKVNINKDNKIGDTFIKVNSLGERSSYGICAEGHNGEINIGGNYLEILSQAEQNSSYGICTDDVVYAQSSKYEVGGTGKITINSLENKIVAISNTNNAYAVSNQDGDNGDINIIGNTYIEAKAPQGKSFSVYSQNKGNIKINENNSNNRVILIGDIQAGGIEEKDSTIKLTEGTVTVNFNGKQSSLTGNVNNAKNGTEEKGITNLSFSNEAVWKNIKDSKVTNLNLEKGIVNMEYDKKHQTIEIENLKGNDGIFVMDISTNDIDQTKGETDFISIKNTADKSNQFIQLSKDSILGLSNYDFENKNPDKAIWFADTDKNVSFEGKEFSSLANIYNYTLELAENVKDTDISADRTNWYITGVEEKENEVPQTVIDDISFLYEAAISRLELDTLHKRMGEIRNYENAQGVWFRTSAGEMKSDVSDSSFENDYYMLQVGYDKKKVSDKGDWFTGFAVSRRENDIDFRNGDGESENIGLSLYKSFAGKDNTYFDLIGKYTYLDTEYKVHNSDSQMKADYDTWAGTLSAEFGKKYSSKNDKWYITPHAQLNYTYVNGEDYTTSTDVRVEQDNIDSLIGRVGVYAGKDFEKSSHYLKASVLSEFMGDYGTTIKGADASLTKEIDGKDTWTEVGIGGNFQVGNSGTTHIYYDIERTFGSRFETQWQGTLGFRISFDKLSDLFTSPVEAPVTIEAANLFDFDKTEIKPEGKEMIKNASEIMNAKKLKGTLSIEGHTDWTGSEEYNQILSEKRAKAVEEVFKENVTNENIKYETKGYGETRPVADNKTKEGRAANRRVEMKFNKN